MSALPSSNGLAGVSVSKTPSPKANPPGFQPVNESVKQDTSSKFLQESADISKSDLNKSTVIPVGRSAETTFDASKFLQDQSSRISELVNRFEEVLDRIGDFVDIQQDALANSSAGVLKQTNELIGNSNGLLEQLIDINAQVLQTVDQVAESENANKSLNVVL